MFPSGDIIIDSFPDIYCSQVVVLTNIHCMLCIFFFKKISFALFLYDVKLYNVVFFKAFLTSPFIRHRTVSIPMHRRNIFCSHYTYRYVNSRNLTCIHCIRVCHLPDIRPHNSCSRIVCNYVTILLFKVM